MLSIKLWDTDLPVCGEYYLTEIVVLNRGSKMAMKTEWEFALEIHNEVLATTKFKVFIKISSDWMRSLLKLMGRTTSLERCITLQ